MYRHGKFSLFEEFCTMQEMSKCQAPSLILLLLQSLSILVVIPG